MTHTEDRSVKMNSCATRVGLDPARSRVSVRMEISI
jgi:hypothetical protein